MEYEIPDQGEDVLFDDSTNPSLKHDDTPPLPRREAGPHADPEENDDLQKAEHIPEEEEQPS